MKNRRLDNDRLLMRHGMGEEGPERHACSGDNQACDDADSDDGRRLAHPTRVSKIELELDVRLKLSQSVAAAASDERRARPPYARARGRASFTFHGTAESDPPLLSFKIVYERAGSARKRSPAEGEACARSCPSRRVRVRSATRIHRVNAHGYCCAPQFGLRAPRLSCAPKCTLLCGAIELAAILDPSCNSAGAGLVKRYSLDAAIDCVS